ncbi:predicted protein [Plenodomus lingam JN3]|uniref:Uncharacterized protein n=1 Tax=Leptosphaeria maculans (strain JN3 / isolate v23.1.3 / race Av1-4-5-6-7-8) TaxID=985895 RepID=E4ZFR2_LEPMJ|nr:predicted protein [Plenodomus lingam JN3]CBX90132.1 predicted protein [Plenodomus lingam JN3]
MISLKSALVAFTLGCSSIATASTLHPGFEDDIALLLADADGRTKHWQIVKPFLDTAFPGITCNVQGNNSLTQGSTSPMAEMIESSLMEYQPSVSCTGELDEHAFAAVFDQFPHVTPQLDFQGLQKRQADCPKGNAPVKPLGRRGGTVRDVEAETQAQAAAARAETEQGYLRCEGASRPANCRACWSGAIAAYVFEIGGCAAVAYKNHEAPRGQIDPAAWLGFICCVGVGLGGWLVATSGCIGR